MAYLLRQQTGAGQDFETVAEYQNCACLTAGRELKMQIKQPAGSNKVESLSFRGLPKAGCSEADGKVMSHNSQNSQNSHDLRPKKQVQSMVSAVRQPEGAVLARYKVDFPALQTNHQIFNHIVCHMVAALFALDSAALLTQKRSTAKTAFARHVAMYICYVTGQQTQRQLGLFFARDRKTIAYACAAIEDLREDPVFDTDLEHLEAFLAEVKNGLADLGSRAIT